MFKIRSGDKVLCGLIEKLVDILASEGAIFNPGLVLEVKGSEFSFTARKRLRANEVLVSLPLRCLPLFSDYHWELDSNARLHYEPVETPESENFEFQRLVVDLLVRIYNHLDKVKAFATSFPVIQLAKNRALINRLVSMDCAHQLQEHIDMGVEQLTIYSYWYGRLFKDNLTGQKRMLPIMEFFDHNLFSGSFLWDGMISENRELQLSYLPVNEKGLFARYEIMDNLHAFVQYGFVDEKAFFLQSQPFKMVLQEGVTLEVGYQSVSANKSDAEDWFPDPSYSNSLMYRALLKFLPDRVFMPYMLVAPQRHMPAFDEALFAQLREIEGRLLDGRRGGLANPETMQKIKEALLRENKAAYGLLGRTAKEAQLDERESSTRELKKMLNHQRKILMEFEREIG